MTACDATLALTVKGGGTGRGTETGAIFLKCDDHDAATDRHRAYLSQTAIGIALAAGTEVVEWRTGP